MQLFPARLHRSRLLGGGLVLAALLLGALGPAVADNASAASPAAMAEHHRQLEIYIAALHKYESEADAYWSRISEKRKIRAAKRHNNKELSIDDYVLAQPPVYSGPPRPVDPSAPPAERPPRTYVPVVADFLQSAAKHFSFTPQLPSSEIAYKSAYAAVASAAGLTPQQAVRVYGFESGGNGNFDVQAGLEFPRPGAHAISTALGYNQLLATNTVELLAEKGDQFLRTLSARAAVLDGEARDRLVRKLAVVKSMVVFSRSVPDDWKLHDELANTPKGLGVHALNLDIDVGPLLQTQKLKDSIVFARAKGYDANLTAAELEMMNLTGDGNGFDMVVMPPAWRDRVPTANFFQPGGYERNPVAIRNNVVGKLIAATDSRMDEEARLPGARELATLFGTGQAASR